MGIPETVKTINDGNLDISTPDLLREQLDNKWPLPKEHFGELLIAKKLITQSQLDEALDAQLRQPSLHLGQLMIDMNLLNEKQIYQTLAFKLGLHFISLQKFDIEPEALDCLNYEQSLKHRLLPLMFDQGILVIATSNPTNHEIANIAEFITGHHLEFVVATPKELSESIDKCYEKFQGNKDISSMESINSPTDITESPDAKTAEQLSKEKPIVRLVHHIISEAVRLKASDIHLRPGEKKVDVIYRIDGALVPIKTLNPSVLPAVISRIKILSGIDISERRIAQDGRAKITLHNKTVDLRISIMPTVIGESAVIRLLDTSNGLVNLEKLGFDKKNSETLNSILSKSCGIFLVTGPTGSGKSTTLYGAINKLRDQNVNIITVENPVEYHIDGIEQMQVNNKVGYSFAKILRNVLRHDPDVIMIGEIRDQETAAIAIESALTGHFVLSTLHTNSASATVSRLLEMGIEPYLISDSLLGVFAQRLVRKNCPHCLSSEKVDEHIYKALHVDTHEHFYHSLGCDKCNNTGYKGRQAVYELLTVSPALKSLINECATAEEIHKQALKDGMTPLTQNALSLARKNITSLAEVYRVRLN